MYTTNLIIHMECLSKLSNSQGALMIDNILFKMLFSSFYDYL